MASAITDPEIVAEVVRLVHEGWGEPRLTPHLGLPSWQVVALLRELRRQGRIPRRRPGECRAKESDARDERARELRGEGWEHAAIARELGCGLNTIRRALEGRDLGRDRVRTGKDRRADERRPETLRLAREGLTTAEIAAELGVPIHVVQVDLVRVAPDDRYADRRIARGERVTAARALAAAGRSIDEIASQLEVTRRTVREYLGQPGNRVRRASEAVRRGAGALHREQARRLRDEGRTHAEIAEVLGVSVESVPYYLRGAPPKPRR